MVETVGTEYIQLAIEAQRREYKRRRKAGAPLGSAALEDINKRIRKLKRLLERKTRQQKRANNG